jgi:5-methyltetrahydropteroyltriglutamate--homocysteine methyltransferase
VRSVAPFRADHVGSLLRPAALKQARAQLLGPDEHDTNLGAHGNAELTAVEDEHIRALVAHQERVGLKSATDGELRRRSWFLELYMSWDGISADRTGNRELAWRSASGKTQPFSRVWIDGPIRRRQPAIPRAFAFLRDATPLVPKITLASPILLHMYGGGNPGILEGHYDDLDRFWADVTAAYREEIAELVEAGARYIQLDSTAMAMLCDPQYRDVVRGWGRDPDDVLQEYARRINDVIAEVPPDAQVTVHECRGNREGMFAAEGGYDPVAEVLFNAVDVDGYFLEYDTSRAGTFEPLRLLPEGEKVVVLGLVSSKVPALEAADDLRRRIEEASRYAPMDQLALGPQCGFASSVKGNPITEDDQWRKLERIVEVATAVWDGI